MLYKTLSAAVYGIDASIIEVEVDVSGIKLDQDHFHTVGLPDAAVRETAMAGPDLVVDLSGSGNIAVDGVADRVTISLPGSGNIECKGLKAKSAKVTLMGSGTVTVYASETLDASVAGSGAIRYDGSPAQVTKSITGSGTITP